MLMNHYSIRMQAARQHWTMAEEDSPIPFQFSDAQGVLTLALNEEQVAEGWMIQPKESPCTVSS